MQLNSPESTRLADEVFRRSGHDWARVRDAATPDADGVLVIDRHKLADPSAAAPHSG